MADVAPARHLLAAKDLVDARYFEPLTVPDLAAAAGLSPAHFSREFKRTFGESPHQYLLTRRLERAAALLRTTDRSIADICFAVGWQQPRLVHHQLPSDVRADPAGLPGHVPARRARMSASRAAWPRPTAARRTARFEKTRPSPPPSVGQRTDPAEEDTMIKIANAQFWVHDQDEALDFYTRTLGWEVRADVTMEAWNFRWLCVGPDGQRRCRGWC